jgi:hypothetical protein
VKVYSTRFSSEPDSKPYLPFDVPTTVALVGELDLPLRWLSTRGDDSGSFYREEDTDTIRKLSNNNQTVTELTTCQATAFRARFIPVVHGI